MDFNVITVYKPRKMGYVSSDYIRGSSIMTTELLLAIAHHLFAFSLLGLLVAELVLLANAPSRSVVFRLFLVDIAYGVAAGSSLAIGIGRILWGGKPTEFYTENPMFWTKMGFWGLVALVSVVPTIRYIVWWRQQELPSTQAFVSTRRLVVLEAVLFAGIPVFAAIMARGIGY